MATQDSSESVLSRAERLRHRSAARREAQRGQLRELLLAVAEEQLLEKGYGGFSLREVAEATQYTPTTIYRHFRDREALIAAVLEKWFLLFARALDEADHPDAAPSERILALGDAYLRFALAQPARYRVMFVDRPDIGILPDGSADLHDDPAFGVLIRVCEALCTAGEAGPHQPIQVAMMFWLGLHGTAAMSACSQIVDARAAQQIGMGIAHLLLRGLRSTP
ncbi:MAG: TetR/AcrR family transcriptional regulator [Gemmatimonas sp.]|jgi:AcrR family transcriptional regulator|uniref:TetR/AcrR family transcriptional regulator n=1 Tax=Gemmatimonas sp. TaxID=1962908 RepID=UPI0022C369C3|nr:TetR/AcrR family transcriptional regulator [Gemmatimonas sp.]MCZ8010835.1 TetR/AcrR family transcriptional regulator [Gemmatimonas sp.]MCZ8266345.1 TetR/AcrR family transcriptional regulator [Gemmatimonas sp.]